MDEATGEWVAKAEGDWNSAVREQRVRKQPNYDPVCFCAQQCAEKYLKALLHSNARPIPKIHDLAKLLDLVKDRYPEIELLRPRLKSLSTFAVEVRYLGTSATKEIGARCLVDAESAREFARTILKLPTRTEQKRKKRG